MKEGFRKLVQIGVLLESLFPVLLSQYKTRLTRHNGYTTAAKYLSTKNEVKDDVKAVWRYYYRTDDALFNMLVGAENCACTCPDLDCPQAKVLSELKNILHTFDEWFKGTYTAQLPPQELQLMVQKSLYLLEIACCLTTGHYCLHYDKNTKVSSVCRIDSVDVLDTMFQNTHVYGLNVVKLGWTPETVKALKGASPQSWECSPSRHFVMMLTVLAMVHWPAFHDHYCASDITRDCWTPQFHQLANQLLEEIGSSSVLIPGHKAAIGTPWMLHN
jgi:hypothetical protein